MPKPTRPLREQVNSIIDPPRVVPQTLPERQPRAPIPARQGIGTSAGSGGASDALDTEGMLISSDGAFVIYYDYHTH